MLKLNLKQVLALAGLAKPTFDARRRRDLHSFLHEARIGDVEAAEYDNSRNRWGFEHVLALRCVDWFVEMHGMSVEVADSIVANNLGELFEAVADGSIDPDEHLAVRGGLTHFMIGRVADVVGRAHVAGTLDAIRDRLLRWSVHYDDHPDNMLAGIVLIDATTVYRQLKAKIIDGLAIG